MSDQEVTKFWLIKYGDLFWDRKILAFIPAVTFLSLKTKTFDSSDECWFLSEEEAETQAKELQLLEVEVEIF